MANNIVGRALVADAARAAEAGSALDAALAGKAAAVHPHSRTGGTLTGFGTAAGYDVGTAGGQLPPLGAGGKLDAGVIPSIPATDVYVVASQAAMLALPATVGDIAKRTDLGTSLVLSAADATVLGNWITLTDASSVTSVNGLSGTVTLTTANVAEGSSLYHTAARVQAVGDARYSLLGHTHDDRYPTDAEVAAAYSPLGHAHDDRYFTEAEADGRYSAAGHLHDDRYYTEAESTALFAGKANLTGGNLWTGGSQLHAVVSPGQRTVYQAQSGYTGTLVDFQDDLEVSRASVTAAGVITAASFVGGGAGLTGLDASNLTSGTVGVDRLGDLPEHPHAQADVTNLVADLAGKAPTVHPHAAADIISGTLAPARLGSGTVDGTRFLRGDQTWAVPSGGGADPFTTMRQTSDVTNATTTLAALPGLSFSYAANTWYEFDYQCVCTSAANTTGYGFALDVSTAAGAGGVHVTFEHALAVGTRTGGYSVGDNGVTAIGVSSGVPLAALEVLVRVTAKLHTGATPGTAQLTFRPELAASATCKAGSTGKVRSIA